MILGVAGKMGPTLAGLAKAALPDRRVIGVARFSDAGVKDLAGGPRHRDHQLRPARRGRDQGAAEIAEHRLHGRPQVRRRGRSVADLGDECPCPGAGRAGLSGSRIVAFSTGCVYPFVPVDGKGADESVPPNPPGEYAQSCVGRERMFEYFSRKFATPGRLFRLNYAIDMRYGVLHDIATKILRASRSTSASAMSISSGRATPPRRRCAASRIATRRPRRSMSAATKFSRVRDLAAKLGARLGREPIIVGTEQPTAWLTDTSQAVKLFGLPIVDTEQLIAWTADWVARSMPSLGKPTKYEVRDGRY